MKKIKLLTLREKVALIAIFAAGSMMTNAQTVKVSGTVGNKPRVDINAKTVIYNNDITDGFAVVRNTTGNLTSSDALIWGAFYQVQPNNPGIFSLMSLSAQSFVDCFTVLANGNTGIFNDRPSVALEIGSTSSNNMMDYVAGNHALSPMQIAKMHQCIDAGARFFYRNCKYKTQFLSITNFTTNKAYIAKQVTIPSRSNIVVGNNSALYINAEEVTIDGQLEVQSGSILNIDIVPSCN